MSRIYNINNHLMKYNDSCIDKKFPPPPTPDTVQIGNQIWASENLEYDDGEGGIDIVECIDTYGNNYGKHHFYTWDAANRIANKINGFHLPSVNEWNTMIQYTCGTGGGYQGPDATPVQSTTDWAGHVGTDLYGFNAKGYGYMDNGNISRVGWNAWWWASNKYSTDEYRTCSISTDVSESHIYAGNAYNQNTRHYSVRLVKD